MYKNIKDQLTSVICTLFILRRSAQNLGVFQCLRRTEGHSKAKKEDWIRVLKVRGTV